MGFAEFLEDDFEVVQKHQQSQRVFAEYPLWSFHMAFDVSSNTRSNGILCPMALVSSGNARSNGIHVAWMPKAMPNRTAHDATWMNEATQDPKRIQTPKHLPQH